MRGNRESFLDSTETTSRSTENGLYANSVSNLSELLQASQRESQLLNDKDLSCRENNPTPMPGFGYQDKPLAELFTNTTLLFADIEGFTAWSSTREPSQVFILLGTFLRHAVIASLRS